MAEMDIIVKERTIKSPLMDSDEEKLRLTDNIIKSLVASGLERCEAKTMCLHELEHALADKYGPGRFQLKMSKCQRPDGSRYTLNEPSYLPHGCDDSPAQRTGRQWLEIFSAPEHPTEDDICWIRFLEEQIRQNPSFADKNISLGF